MRRDALDGKGAGDADLPVVLVGLVVEVLVLRARGNAGVDFALAGDPGLPEALVSFARGLVPVILRLPGYFPFKKAVGGSRLTRRKSDRAPRWGSEVDRLALAAAVFDGEWCGVVPQGVVEIRQGILDFRLKPLIDHVDLGVVGDGLQRYVGDALVHETVPEVVVRGCFRRGLAGERGFFELTFAAVGEQVVRIPGTHDPRSR